MQHCRDGFAQLVRAEWTKLRSVRRWTLGLLAAVGVTVLVSLVAAAASGTDANRHPDFVTGPDGGPVVDDSRFVHQPLAGDGSIVARVVDLAAGHERSAAGIMIKAGTTSGSPYAALLVTGQGVRLRADFTTDRAGTSRTAPRWLRLSRTDTAVTGYESADGIEWRPVGTVRVPGLPPTARAGLVVLSPPRQRVERSAGSTAFGESPTVSTATFDGVRLTPESATWTSDDIRGPVDLGPPGETAQRDGVFTVAGSGEIGPKPPPDDVVQISLVGSFFGLLAVVAVAVLFVTAEYRRGMIRSTLAASPRRLRVLAAKAAVIGAATFVAGLAASAAAFLLAQPLLRGNGFAPPAFPPPSLTDPSVLRAVVGTAGLLATAAVFSLAMGVVLRRSAPAITLVIVLLVLPTIVGTLLPVGAARWLMLLTPAGGFAIQRVKEPTGAIVEPWSMIEPWAGFGALCAYAVLGLVVAGWSLRRRDA